MSFADLKAGHRSSMVDAAEKITLDAPRSNELQLPTVSEKRASIFSLGGQRRASKAMHHYSFAASEM